MYNNNTNNSFNIRLEMNRNNKQRTKGSHIIYSKMLFDNRRKKAGNWVCFYITNSKRKLFKYKKFERVSAYAFFPFYCELSNSSKIYGLNLIFLNLEIHRHL